LRRAGLDYHEFCALREYDNLDAFMAQIEPARLLAFTTKASKVYTEMIYQSGDALLFGPETRGLPTEILDCIEAEKKLCLPMQPGSRSLNLSNAVAVVLYEAWRQLGFEIEG